MLFDTLSPSMYCAAQKDPVLAIVLHSSIRDVDTVIVDGCIRKRRGELLPVKVMDYEEAEFVPTGRQAEWPEVARHVMELQTRFRANMEDYNLVELEATIRKNWGLA